MVKKISGIFFFLPFELCKLKLRVTYSHILKVMGHFPEKFGRLFFSLTSFPRKLIVNVAPKTDRRELVASTKNRIVGMKMAGLSGREIAKSQTRTV